MSIDKVTLAKIKMINMGIVPAMTGIQLSDMLNSMPLKERRLAKRKFRKAWRKIAKNDETFSYFLKPGEKDPDRSIKSSRAAIVSMKFINEAKANK